MTYGQEFFDVQESKPMPGIPQPMRQTIYEKAVEFGCTLDGQGCHLLVMINTAGVNLSNWISQTYPCIFANVMVTENHHRFHSSSFGWMKILYCYDPYWREKK